MLHSGREHGSTLQLDLPYQGTELISSSGRLMASRMARVSMTANPGEILRGMVTVSLKKNAPFVSE
jgi:hypothetical protein